MNNVNALYHGYIYITTNLTNNKKYIGMHANSVHNLDYLGSGVALKHAVKKYGRENFTNEIIEWCTSPEHMCEREIFHIDEANAVKSKDYYNMCGGGMGVGSGENHHSYGKARTQSDETKAKISVANSGENNGNYGKE